MLLFFFVANNIVLAAWIKSCALDHQENTIVSVDEFSSDDTPCHEQAPEQDSTQCENLCLCLNLLVTQTPVLDSHHVYTPADHWGRIIISDTFLHSTTLTPLYRPPISIS